MSVQFTAVGDAGDQRYLHDALLRFKGVLQWARPAIGKEDHEAISATVRRCDDRLARGVDHTVVALAGGTGSGKSTLFNRISGKRFSIEGVARPTTSEVSAAAWSREADALLEWLGVEPQRRLTGLSGSGLDGLVLLDLPDHDSISDHNRGVVERVLPMADLLVWVVDPQKYADYALHERFLKDAARTQQPSVVVLNHTDRLTTQQSWEVAKDLQRLLSIDGLEELAVIPLSARTGEGTEVLMERLTTAVGSRTVAAEAVRGDLADASRTLAGLIEPGVEPRIPDGDALIASIAQAAGVLDKAEEARGAVETGRAQDIRLSLSDAAIDKRRREWIAYATDGLPQPWVTVVDHAIDTVAQLREDLEGSLATISWPKPEQVPAWRFLKRARARRRAYHDTVDTGTRAIAAVIGPNVLTPTRAVHDAYRALADLVRPEAWK